MTPPEFLEWVAYLIYEEEQELTRYGKMDYLIAWLILLVRKTLGCKGRETIKDFLIPWENRRTASGVTDWKTEQERIARELAGWATSLNGTIKGTKGAKKSSAPSIKEIREHVRRHKQQQQRVGK